MTNYERAKVKQYLRRLKIILPTVQIMALLFFTVVGQLETTDTDGILRTSEGLTTLATTLSFSVLTIYLTYQLNRHFLMRYIGSFRLRTYAYPGGRDQMFTSHLQAFLEYSLMVYLLSLSGVNLIFGWVGMDGNHLGQVIRSFKLLILSALICVSILFTSIIMGLKFQTTNASLIASIIMVAMVGNLVAYCYTLKSVILYVLMLFFLLVNGLLWKKILMTIARDDVLQ